MPYTACIRAIFGHFRILLGAVAPPQKPFRTQEKAQPIDPDLLCPYQTLNNFYQPFCGLQGYLWLQKGHFRPLWRPMAPHKGLSGPGKRPKHIAPDVPWPDQTLIIFDQPVWSLQGDFCLQKVFLIIFLPFLAIFGYFDGLWRPPEAFPDPRKGPNILSQTCPSWIKP